MYGTTSATQSHSDGSKADDHGERRNSEGNEVEGESEEGGSFFRYKWLPSRRARQTTMQRMELQQLQHFYEEKDFADMEKEERGERRGRKKGKQKEQDSSHSVQGSSMDMNVGYTNLANMQMGNRERDAEGTNLEGIRGSTEEMLMEGSLSEDTIEKKKRGRRRKDILIGLDTTEKDEQGTTTTEGAASAEKGRRGTMAKCCLCNSYNSLRICAKGMCSRCCPRDGLPCKAHTDRKKLFLLASPVPPSTGSSLSSVSATINSPSSTPPSFPASLLSANMSSLVSLPVVTSLPPTFVSPLPFTFATNSVPTSAAQPPMKRKRAYEEDEERQTRDNEADGERLEKRAKPPQEQFVEQKYQAGNVAGTTSGAEKESSKENDKDMEEGLTASPALTSLVNMSQSAGNFPASNFHTVDQPEGMGPHKKCSGCHSNNYLRLCPKGMCRVCCPRDGHPCMPHLLKENIKKNVLETTHRIRQGPMKSLLSECGSSEPNNGGVSNVNEISEEDNNVEYGDKPTCSTDVNNFASGTLTSSLEPLLLAAAAAPVIHSENNDPVKQLQQLQRLNQYQKLDKNGRRIPIKCGKCLAYNAMKDCPKLLCSICCRKEPDGVCQTHAHFHRSSNRKITPAPAPASIIISQG